MICCRSGWSKYPENIPEQIILGGKAGKKRNRLTQSVSMPLDILLTSLRPSAAAELPTQNKEKTSQNTFEQVNHKPIGYVLFMLVTESYRYSHPDHTSTTSIGFI